MQTSRVSRSRWFLALGLGFVLTSGACGSGSNAEPPTPVPFGLTPGPGTPAPDEEPFGLTPPPDKTSDEEEPFGLTPAPSPIRNP